MNRGLHIALEKSKINSLNESASFCKFLHYAYSA